MSKWTGVTQRTWLILNPAAGFGRAGRRWPATEGHLREAGIGFVLHRTTGPGHAINLARRAREERVETIIVVGGDGTLNEVVTGFLGSGTEPPPAAELPAIGVIPAGTGRDFGRALGIKRGQAAVASLRTGAPRATDVGLATFTDPTGAEAARPFINAADFGLGPETSQRVERGAKILGPAAYLSGALVSIARYAPTHISLEVDGDQVFRGPSGIVTVANGPYFGGGMHAAPAARLDDGLFEVVILSQTTRRTLVTQLLPRVYRGTHIQHPAVRTARGAIVTVTADQPFPLELDGEIVGTTPARFTMLPGALRVIQPAPRG